MVGVFLVFFTANTFNTSLNQPEHPEWNAKTAQLETILASYDLPDDALIALLSVDCTRGLQPSLFEAVGFSRDVWSQVVYELDVVEDLDMFFNQLCFVTQFEFVYKSVMGLEETPAEVYLTLVDRILNAEAGMTENQICRLLDRRFDAS